MPPPSAGGTFAALDVENDLVADFNDLGLGTSGLHDARDGDIVFHDHASLIEEHGLVVQHDGRLIRLRKERHDLSEARNRPATFLGVTLRSDSRRTAGAPDSAVTVGSGRI
jgi:hypothetical protein